MQPYGTDESVSPRNIVILKVRVANPTASTRELSDILDAEYGIELSHNRISEILREMAEDELYRETVIPDQRIFNHYLFRLSFYYPNFADQWEDCYWALRDDPHVLMFFNADSAYHWQFITQFRSNDRMQRWIHEFFKEFGEFILGFHNTVLHQVHKFQTDAEVFDEMLKETDEGREYLAAGGDDQD